MIEYTSDNMSALIFLNKYFPFNQSLDYSLLEKRDGETTAAIGLFSKQKDSNSYYIALAVNSNYSNFLPFTKEVCKYLFEVLNLDSVIAIVDAANTPSRDIVEHVGFIKDSDIIHPELHIVVAYKYVLQKNTCKY